MSPQLFLDQFLPLRAEMTAEVLLLADKLKGCFDAVQPVRRRFMYKPLIEALQPYVRDMVFLDTHAHKDPNRDKLSPDISLYHAKNLPGTNENPVSFAKMSTFIELERAGSASLSSIEYSDINIAKIASYSSAISGAQFRVHILSVSIFGSNARFIHWDRGGPIVTSSFDYVANPEPLISFFWRYSRLQHPDHQEYDTITIYDASQEELALVKGGWLVKTIRDYLKRDTWPEDRAGPQKIGAQDMPQNFDLETGSKRRAPVDEDDEGQGRSKRQHSV